MGRRPCDDPPEFKVGEFHLSLRTNPRTGVEVAYKERAPEYTSADDSHGFYELLYVDKGQIRLRLDSQVIDLSQGEFVIILPRQKHSVEASGRIAPFYVTAHFDTNLLSVRRLGNRVLRVDEQGRRLVIGLLEETASSEFGSFGMVRCYLAEFLIRATRLQARYEAGQRVDPYFRSNAGGQLVERVLAYLALNLNKPVALQDIARGVGVSQSHLEHTLKKGTGRSVLAHLQELRIEKAKRLLLESPLNISQIAAECGYSSLQLFSRRFRKWVSVCPTEYARMVRSALPSPAKGPFRPAKDLTAPSARPRAVRSRRDRGHT